MYIIFGGSSVEGGDTFPLEDQWPFWPTLDRLLAHLEEGRELPAELGYMCRLSAYGDAPASWAERLCGPL